jgi:hypothetical protein
VPGPGVPGNAVNLSVPCQVGHADVASSGRRLTDHGDDEHDEEGVAHREDGGGERGEDLLGGVEPPEEARDAQGAEGAHDGDGDVVEGAQDDEGHADDDEVEDGPAVGEEVPEPVGEEIDAELDREDDGEAQVDDVDRLLDGGQRAVGGVELLSL